MNSSDPGEFIHNQLFKNLYIDDAASHNTISDLLSLRKGKKAEYEHLGYNQDKYKRYINL